MGSIIRRHVDHLRRRWPESLDVAEGMDKNPGSSDSCQQNETTGRAETSTSFRMSQNTTPGDTCPNNQPSNTPPVVHKHPTERIGELPEYVSQDNQPQPSEVTPTVPDRRSERLRKPPKCLEDFVCTCRPE